MSSYIRVLAHRASRWDDFMKGVNKVRKSRRGDYVGLKQYLLPIVNGDGKIKDGQFSTILKTYLPYQVNKNNVFQ